MFSYIDQISPSIKGEFDLEGILRRIEIDQKLRYDAT